MVMTRPISFYFISLWTWPRPKRNYLRIANGPGRT